MSAYDAIIIGTGQAGAPLAHRLSGAGMKVAIAERGRFGGTCVNTGCIPTKTLVANAYVARMVARAAEFGVNAGVHAGVDAGAAHVDLKKVMARKEEISGDSRRKVEAGLRALANCTVLTGHARFASPREVVVGAEQLTAEKIFINVGGRALVPPMPGVGAVPFLTNSSILELDEVPEHLLIVGGSYVGLEFGQIFRRFGSEVTIIEMGPRLVGHEDEDVSAAIRTILEQEGIRVRLNATCIGFEAAGKGVTARVDCASDEPEVSGSHVLLAVGRRPNTDDLRLDRAGVTLDARGYIVVDDRLQTSVPGIWALGDCNGKGGFTHTSYNDYEIVAANLLDGGTRRVTDRILAYALYTDPPLGRAGMTEAEVRRSGRPARVATLAMSRVGRAIEKGETQGFMKLLVDSETRTILGASILGTGGDEVIHSILELMYAGGPYTVLQQTVHIHPTVSEYLPTLVGVLRPLSG
jgi:pyruvate/2-oxoglutarate dehydrogenase complex dihydrolipoamide dehydrogenase (E3) component